MKGREHYEESEHILLMAQEYEEKYDALPKETRNPHAHMAVLNTLYAHAQVHATLALTMATLVGMERADWGD